MLHWVFFGIGMVIGVGIGIMMMCLAFVASEADEHTERIVFEMDEDWAA